MGFHPYSSPYDWSRIARYKAEAQAVDGGLIDMSVGSPVDPVAPGVQRALAAAADAPGYPATQGTDDLRDAIGTWFHDLRGVDLKALDAHVVPTVGSKEAVALMASLLHLGSGEVVVQPQVSYPTYEIGTQLAGARVLKVADVADVDAWEHVPGVKAVWVNSPCNPSGRIVDADRLAGIVAAARRIGAVVLSDECYALMDWRAAARSNEPQAADVFSLTAAPCALNPAVCEGSAEGVLVLYSLSKQSNMAGYRAALIAGDGRLVRQMGEYRRQIGQIIPGQVQAAMAAGLRDVAAVHTQWKRYRSRLARLVEALRAYGYDAAMPDGGLYLWVRALGGDCWSDMADMAGLGLLASPGEFYGDSGHLRFSATVSDEAVDSACRRLEAASSR